MEACSKGGHWITGIIRNGAKPILIRRNFRRYSLLEGGTSRGKVGNHSSRLTLERGGRKIPKGGIFPQKVKPGRKPEKLGTFRAPEGSLIGLGFIGIFRAGI